MCDMSRMPGTWIGAAISFEAMWIVMMTVMMLPVLIPMLAHYRTAVSERGGRRLVLVTAMAAAYLFTWAVVGVGIFAAGGPLMRAGSVTWPIVVLAGAWQFTPIKARQLACCREPLDRRVPSDVRTAWRHGLRFGARCVRCCANLTVILIAVGMMDVLVMGLVTAAIAAERVPASGERAARVSGAAAIAAALVQSARAAGLA